MTLSDLETFDKYANTWKCLFLMLTLREGSLCFHILCDGESLTHIRYVILCLCMKHLNGPRTVPFFTRSVLSEYAIGIGRQRSVYLMRRINNAGISLPPSLALAPSLSRFWCRCNCGKGPHRLWFTLDKMEGERKRNGEWEEETPRVKERKARLVVWLNVL